LYPSSILGQIGERHGETAMTITTTTLRHDHKGVLFEALAAWDDAIAGPRPLVLVAGTFMGRTGYEDERAKLLAALGYVAVAIDVYGADNKPTSFDEARAAMQLLNDDRALLRERLEASLAIARGLEDVVDPAKAAAIGYCFGGKCVLDLARAGADVLGVVSFHGVYDRPPFANAAITAKALVLHGWDDPLGPPDAVIGLADELTEAKVDWQLHAYGHTVHGFTNPKRPEMFSPVADARSWQAATNFLAEIFA
jgi:dienelactone hydrolase